MRLRNPDPLKIPREMALEGHDGAGVPGGGRRRVLLFAAVILLAMAGGGLFYRFRPQPPAEGMGIVACPTVWVRAESDLMIGRVTAGVGDGVEKGAPLFFARPILDGFGSAGPVGSIESQARENEGAGMNGAISAPAPAPDSDSAAAERAAFLENELSRQRERRRMLQERRDRAFLETERLTRLVALEASSRKRLAEQRERLNTLVREIAALSKEISATDRDLKNARAAMPKLIPPPPPTIAGETHPSHPSVNLTDAATEKAIPAEVGEIEPAHPSADPASAAAGIPILEDAVTAPVAGRVLRLDVREGGVALRGEPLAEIADRAGVGIIGYFPRRSAAGLAAGARVRIIFPDGTEGAGRVTGIVGGPGPGPARPVPGVVVESPAAPEGRHLTARIAPPAGEADRWMAYGNLSVSLRLLEE